MSIKLGKHVNKAIFVSVLCSAVSYSVTATANSDLCYEYDYTHPTSSVYAQGMTDAENAAIFARGMQAAACIGYYTRMSDSLLDEDVKSMLKNVVAPAAQIVEETCEREGVITVGDAEQAFEIGATLVVANAALVSKGQMSSKELRARGQACSDVTTHYFNILTRLSK